MIAAARKAGLLLTGLCCLLVAPVPTVSAEPFTLAVLGDSISDTYFLKVSLVQRGWTDQLRILRPGRIQLYNRAEAGSTSTTLLRQGHPEAVARLVRQGKVANVCLIIGGNDFAYPILFGSANPHILTETAAQLVQNVTQAVDTVLAAGPVAMVLGNVPDLGQTPMFRSWATSHPTNAVLLRRLTLEVNQQLEALARQRGIAVVDLYSLVRLSRHSVIVGGVEVSKSLYTSEGLHPSTVGSALLGNAILEAFHRGYGRDVSGLQLTDAEILDEIGQKPTAQGRFDVSRFVILPRPTDAARVDTRTDAEGSSPLAWPGRSTGLVLAGGIVAGGGIAYWLWRRRRV
jgi:lysophospholipase L1-like esterase